MDRFTKSAFSIAVDYVNASRSLIQDFRQWATERAECPFLDVPDDRLLSLMDQFLREGMMVWVKPTRVMSDEDSWVDYCKKARNALMGHPVWKKVVINGQLRKEHAKPPAVSPDRLYGHCEAVLASLPKSERGKELYRYVQFEIRPIKAKRAADALDLMPYEGSTHPGSDTLYPGASAPVTRVDGIDRTVTVRADKDTETRLSAAREKISALRDLRSLDRKYRETLRIRARFIAREYRERIDALVAENARLHAAIADLTAPKTRSRAKKPTTTPTVV